MAAVATTAAATSVAAIADTTTITATVTATSAAVVLAFGFEALSEPKSDEHGRSPTNTVAADSPRRRSFVPASGCPLAAFARERHQVHLPRRLSRSGRDNRGEKERKKQAKLVVQESAPILFFLINVVLWLRLSPTLAVFQT